MHSLYNKSLWANIGQKAKKVSKTDVSSQKYRENNIKGLSLFKDETNWISKSKCNCLEVKIH